MPDEPNASLNEVVTLLRRQVEQADNSAKRAEEAAAEERQRRAKTDSQKVRVSRLIALLAVTAVIAWAMGVSNRHTLQLLTDGEPADYFKKRLETLQKASYAVNYFGMLILGGLYFAIVDYVAFVVRWVFMTDK